MCECSGCECPEGHNIQILHEPHYSKKEELNQFMNVVVEDLINKEFIKLNKSKEELARYLEETHF